MPRRRSSAPLLPLPILIVIIPIIALLLLFFIIPLFLSLTSKIFRPYNTVKKGWDSLNILLVLFAILCGIFARRNDDGSTPADNANNLNNVSDISDGMDTNPSNPRQWFDDDQYPNAKVYDRPISTPVTSTSRLRRSSSSYPDLRQDSLWETGEDRFRFFDDFHIRHSYRSPDNNVHQPRRTRSDFEEYSEVKVIPVDTFVLRSSPAPPPKSPTQPPPPPPPPPPVVRQRPIRTYQNVGRKDMSVESDVDIKKAESPPMPPAPPPPPPRRAPPPPAPRPVQMGYRSEQKHEKIERRKSNATKEIKMVLASLYNQRKRIKRKHRTKNVEEYSKPVHSPPQYSNIPPPSPPPPPPPLPPHPSSVFQNLFKKSSKSKKVHSVPPPAPPPPPPPRSSKRKSQARPPTPPPPPAPPKPPLQPSRRRNAATSGKPPLPVRANNSYDENMISGNQSPLIPVPPPPPPFKMPEFRFVVRGDFVSIHSARNSRCSSPDREEVVNDIPSTKESTADKVNLMGGGDEVGSVFCPSPDVNVKADTFIARLRDGWRLEKINSLREKQNMSPGPGPGPLTR